MSNSKKNTKKKLANTDDDDNEPENPALKEPDSMAILQKSEGVGPTVSHERKKKLLVKARAERRR